MYCFTLKCGSVSLHFYMSDSSFSTIVKHYSKFKQKIHFFISVCCCVWHALRLPALLASVWQIGKYVHMQSDSQHIVHEIVWMVVLMSDGVDGNLKSRMIFYSNKEKHLIPWAIGKLFVTFGLFFLLRIISKVYQQIISEWIFNDIFDYKRKYWLLDIYKTKIAPTS